MAWQVDLALSLGDALAGSVMTMGVQSVLERNRRRHDSRVAAKTAAVAAEEAWRAANEGAVAELNRRQAAQGERIAELEGIIEGAFRTAQLNRPERDR